MADHNDPNAVNSIFSDIDVSAADLYDLFGFPADARAPNETVVIALTFAAVPNPGTLDPDMLYRIQIAPGPRITRESRSADSLNGMLEYIDGLKTRYLSTLRPSEIRVTTGDQGATTIRLTGFPGGDITSAVSTNTVTTLKSPKGHDIKIYIGGRDDAFFNDLPGFFRSINYAPQFYHVPLAMSDMRELKIPKTLLELEGNTLFNYDPANPQLGSGVKKDLPPGPYTWSGNKFHKDANGNFRFVYSGK